jgi:hypothetical protein
MLYLIISAFSGLCDFFSSPILLPSPFRKVEASSETFLRNDVQDGFIDTLSLQGPLNRMEAEGLLSGWPIAK